MDKVDPARRSGHDAAMEPETTTSFTSDAQKQLEAALSYSGLPMSRESKLAVPARSTFDGGLPDAGGKRAASNTPSMSHGRHRKASPRQAAMAKVGGSTASPVSKHKPDDPPSSSHVRILDNDDSSLPCPPDSNLEFADQANDPIPSTTPLPATSCSEPSAYLSSDEEESLSFHQPSATSSISSLNVTPQGSAMSAVRQRSCRDDQRISPAAVLEAPDIELEEEWDYSETEWWGWVVLVVTWLLFVVVMGSCLGVWSWAWDVGETPYAPPELEDDATLPITGYYPALMVCTAIMAWVWVVVAWVGMKYFRHAKVGVDG
ncbi:hypothetical protein ACN47E_005733 [Coniothyrium glycines]